MPPFQLSALHLGLLLLFPVTTALAESAAITEDVALPQIQVMATKTELDVFTVPESVSVVDRETIEIEQPTNFGDLLLDLPNVAVGGGSRGVGQQVVIRGLSDERLVFLVDGARQNFQRAHNARVFIEPELLRQVEVLRGPASALWGSGAIGGVVALQTVDAQDLLRPGQALGAYGKLGYQDGDGQWLTSASVYGVADEQLDYLLNLSYRDAGDVRLGDGSDLDHSGFERWSGLAKGTWSPDDRNRFGISLSGLNEDGEVPSNPQTEATDANLVERETDQLNLALTYRYEDPSNPWLRPSALVYYNETDIDERRISDGRHDETRLETTGFDLRNSTRFGEGGAISQMLSYGIEYYQDEADSKRDGEPRDGYPGGSQDVLGIYLQDEILIGERWTLVPGIRWDDYETEADDSDLDASKDSAWSAKLGINFAVTDWLSLQASYNEAFRAPSITELFVSGVHFTCGPGCANLFVPNPDLEPEKAHNKEIGLRLRKANLFAGGDEGRFQASFFRNDVEDFIDQIVIFSPFPMPGNPGAGGINTSRNVSDAKLDGFEIEAAYESPRWLVSAAYSQTRGEDDDTGEPLGSVQPDEWLLRAGLRFPSEGLQVGWRGRLVAAQDEVPEGVTPSDSYDVHDIWLRWQPVTSLTLDFGVDNLLDEDYAPYLSSLTAPGRNIKAAITYRF